MIRDVYIQKGRFADALADIDKYTPEDTLWDLAYVLGRSGRPVEAKRALDKLHQLNQQRPVDPASFAWAYTGIGDKDQAFLWLERAYTQHSNSLTSLKVEPGLDPLRSDPRFQLLLQRIGLAN